MFSNYAPSELEFSRLSEIDCTNHFEIRPNTPFRAYLNFGPYIVSWGENRLSARFNKGLTEKTLNHNFDFLGHI